MNLRRRWGCHASDAPLRATVTAKNSAASVGADRDDEACQRDTTDSGRSAGAGPQRWRSSASGAVDGAVEGRLTSPPATSGRLAPRAPQQVGSVRVRG